jgi:hypothetical protein
LRSEEGAIRSAKVIACWVEHAIVVVVTNYEWIVAAPESTELSL